MNQTRKVRCPQCGKVTDYSPENKSRPFCSARCRTLDLGAWADEKFRIPTEDSKDLNTDENTEPTDEDMN